MNWFSFAQILVSIGAGCASIFVKNDKNKKTADALVHLAGIFVEGLANQNPDGTPATQPFAGTVTESPVTVTIPVVEKVK